MTIYKGSGSGSGLVLVTRSGSGTGSGSGSTVNGLKMSSELPLKLNCLYMASEIASELLIIASEKKPLTMA